MLQASREEDGQRCHADSIGIATEGASGPGDDVESPVVGLDYLEMTQNHDYKVLILTSDPDTIDRVTRVGETHFDNATVLFWEMGNMSTKAAVLQQIEDTQYNLLISYINGIILKRRHLEKAHFGSINIHPAPPEHGGAWGIWSQPVICRGFRTHHGVTVHEMDEDIDHGPIYQVQRWEVGEDATIQSVVERSFSDCMVAYEQVPRSSSSSTARDASTTSTRSGTRPIAIIRS